MTAIVSIGTIKATVVRAVWTCEHKDLEKLLNLTVDPMSKSPATPNPDWNEAKRVEQEFGAKIIRIYPVPNPSKPGTIY